MKVFESMTNHVYILIITWMFSKLNSIGFLERFEETAAKGLSIKLDSILKRINYYSKINSF